MAHNQRSHGSRVTTHQTRPRRRRAAHRRLRSSPPSASASAGVHRSIYLSAALCQCSAASCALGMVYRPGRWLWTSGKTGRLHTARGGWSGGRGGLTRDAGQDRMLERTLDVGEGLGIVDRHRMREATHDTTLIAGPWVGCCADHCHTGRWTRSWTLDRTQDAGWGRTSTPNLSLNGAHDNLCEAWIDQAQ